MTESPNVEVPQPYGMWDLKIGGQEHTFFALNMIQAVSSLVQASAS